MYFAEQDTVHTSARGMQKQTGKKFHITISFDFDRLKSVLRQ